MDPSENKVKVEMIFLKIFKHAKTVVVVVGMVNTITHCYNVSVNRTMEISLESHTVAQICLRINAYSFKAAGGSFK